MLTPPLLTQDSPHPNYHSVSSTECKPSQAKVLTGGGDLREAQVDVPLSVSHSRI